MLVPAQGSEQADEWHRLGLEAQGANQLGLAQHRYQQALRLDPRHSLATNNLAIVFAQSNMLHEALLTIERAALFDSRRGVIEMNWAIMEADAERYEEALKHARRALELGPKDVPAILTLALIVAAAGLAEEAVPLYNRVLDIEPTHMQAGMNSCFVQTLTEDTAPDLLRQRQRYHQANKQLNGKLVKYTNQKTCDRPLRVGYVSGDFKGHSASFIFSNVLLHHTSAVEMYLYSTLPVDPVADLMTKMFQDAAGARWRDIVGLNDENAKELILKDQIDILVDLSAHSSGGRLPLFMLRPAPVQVTAWGFAHGTGCPEVDYFFADPVAVPLEERQYWAEKIYDLPCIVTMRPLSDYNLKGSSKLPLSRNGYVTFGCYARYEKISHRSLLIFAEILRRVPESRLEFKDAAFRRPYSIKRVLAAMPDIEPERLLFSLNTNHPDHLLAYQQADLILNPFPHSSGTVCMEQLYQGVPIITLVGSQPSGRTAASVLTAMGRTDWVVRTTEEYVEKAVELSGCTRLLTEVRKTLRDELLNSPVVKGYVEAVEKAYQDIWGTYAAS